MAWKMSDAPAGEWPAAQAVKPAKGSKTAVSAKLAAPKPKKARDAAQRVGDLKKSVKEKGMKKK